jgi:hypothetical protein
MSINLLEDVGVNSSSTNECYLVTKSTTPSNSVLLIRAADVNNDSF